MQPMQDDCFAKFSAIFYYNIGSKKVFPLFQVFISLKIKLLKIRKLYQ
jgi:hypothetical protein